MHRQYTTYIKQDAIITSCFMYFVYWRCIIYYNVHTYIIINVAKTWKFEIMTNNCNIFNIVSRFFTRTKSCCQCCNPQRTIITNKNITTHLDAITRLSAHNPSMSTRMLRCSLLFDYKSILLQSMIKDKNTSVEQLSCQTCLKLMTSCDACHKGW